MYYADIRCGIAVFHKRRAAVYKYPRYFLRHADSIKFCYSFFFYLDELNLF